MSYRYIDVHCHPNLGALKEDQNDVIARMKDDGVMGIVVGVDLSSSKEAVALADTYDHLFATIGLHPNDTPHEDFVSEKYAPLAKHPKVIAVGECGLDFYRIPKEVDIEKEKERQWKVLKSQVSFALEHNLPLMIHCRPSAGPMVSSAQGSGGPMDAYEDLLSFLEPLKKENQALSGNIHFFVVTLAIAKRFWAIDFTTSLTGVITFAREYDEVVQEAPLSMLLSETDAPYVAPVPHRGKRNEPVYVRHVVEKIAELRGISQEEVATALLKNAARVFKIEGLV